MTEPILIRRSPIVIIKDLILLEFVVTGAYFLAALMANYGELYRSLSLSQLVSYEIAKFFFIAFAETLLVAFIFLRWLYTVYTIRPSAVIKERGIIMKKREVIPLAHPISVFYEYAPLSQIFAYGTLGIRTASREKPVRLMHIANPDLVSRVISEMMQAHAEESAEPIAGASVTLDDLLKTAERENLEFKSTFRWDVNTSKVNRDLEQAAIKTAAALLNSGGGHLLIGVDDAGVIRGLAPDYATLKKPNPDGFENHFTNVFKEMIGSEFRRFVKLSFPETDKKPVCVVQVLPGAKPAYVRTDRGEVFYIRTGNSTTALQVSEAANYIRSRWKKY
ncbi:MAG: putative DNA binding domain-containing protein [Candidatus Niyogibacteria bacterium]|nr:putative DNA binding domain-containing protein [Candidatus Niyogibacteria bacterium]